VNALRAALERMLGWAYWTAVLLLALPLAPLAWQTSSAWHWIGICIDGGGGMAVGAVAGWMAPRAVGSVADRVWRAFSADNGRTIANNPLTSADAADNPEAR
jgi:hypothetical protein